MDIFLTILSGVGWMIVYEECIRLGYKHKTYSMPLFALGLNIAWESIYSVADIAWEAHGPLTGMNVAQEVANILWCLLDVAILVSYILYGRDEWKKSGMNKWSFYVWLAVVLLTSYALQIIFIVEFGFEMGSQYSAFLQNVIMSVLFIKMFIARRGSEGQSILLAVAKWIGTLAPAILMGMMTFNPLVLTCGILCTVFDLIYIAMLVADKILAKSGRHLCRSEESV